MDNQKFNLVLDKLLEKTKAEKLEWETTADRNTFLAVLKDSAISINYDEIYDGISLSEFFTFDFRNENGSIVESVVVADSIHTKKDFQKSKQIFDLAHQQALDIDKTLDHILEQLAA